MFFSIRFLCFFYIRYHVNWMFKTTSIYLSLLFCIPLFFKQRLRNKLLKHDKSLFIDDFVWVFIMNKTQTWFTVRAMPVFYVMLFTGDRVQFLTLLLLSTLFIFYDNSTGVKLLQKLGEEGCLQQDWGDYEVLFTSRCFHRGICKTSFTTDVLF